MNKPNYNELLPFARTDNQRKAVTACIEKGSQRKAAKAIGMHPRNVEKIIARLKKYKAEEESYINTTADSDMDNDNDSDSDTADYANPHLPIMAAINPDTGRVMPLKEFCEYHKLDFNQVNSSKMINHNGLPYYNIVFKDNPEADYIDMGEAMDILKKEFSSFRLMPFTAQVNRKKEAVLTLSDLHLGAYVDGLIRTQEFSIGTVVEKLSKARDYTNSFGYEKVHVHILGDLIESFTGLNHKNTWKNLGKGMFGAEVVKLTTKILHEFLSSVANLGTIKIVGGNHDRLTSDKTEDSGGGAADLIAWGLELIGYDVEFNPIILTHNPNGINYVLTHGHHMLSKKATKEIIWDYGEKGLFNFVMEGHLHSRIQKLTTANKKNFKTLKDDSVDCRRQVCPSIFTGNSYSEELGYTTTAGFLLSENNGDGLPNVFDFAL